MHKYISTDTVDSLIDRFSNLTYAGKQLERGRTFMGYNIQHLSTLYPGVGLLGGAWTRPTAQQLVEAYNLSRLPMLQWSHDHLPQRGGELHWLPVLGLLQAKGPGVHRAASR